MWGLFCEDFDDGCEGVVELVLECVGGELFDAGVVGCGEVDGVGFVVGCGFVNGVCLLVVDVHVVHCGVVGFGEWGGDVVSGFV